MQKNVYIKPETDAALQRIGGADRAKQIRRAVALAECAGELANTLWWIADNYAKDDQALINQSARDALNKYRGIKNEIQ